MATLLATVSMRLMEGTPRYYLFQEAILVGLLVLFGGAAIAEDVPLIACAIQPISAVPIVPSTDLASLDCASSIHVVAAIGELEPATLALQSTRSVDALVVEVSDLSGAKGRIPSKHIDIRYVKAWYQSGSAWEGVRQDRTKRVLVPELLLKDDSLIRVSDGPPRNFVRLSGRKNRYVDISQSVTRQLLEVPSIDSFPVVDSRLLLPLLLESQQTKQIWLTFDIPEGTPAGDYRGVVAITSVTPKLALKMPILLKVLPFSLPRPVIEYSIYYRGQLDPTDGGSVSSELKTLTQLRAELRNMARHGISNPTVYQEPEPISAFQMYLNERSAAGLDQSPLYYLGITTGEYENKQRNSAKLAALKSVISTAQIAGAHELLVYGIDEAEPPHILGQLELWKRIRASGAGIFAAAWRNTAAEAVYAGTLDVLVLGSSPSAAANRSFRQKGTRVFAYNMPQVGVENPLVYRLAYGLRAWQYQFDGVMDYAYQHSMGSIWNDFDHPGFRDHVFAYPTVDGVIDTIAWEGFREGVDDLRYLAALLRLAATGEYQAARQEVEMLRNDLTTDPSTAREQMARLLIDACATVPPTISVKVGCRQ